MPGPQYLLWVLIAVVGVRLVALGMPTRPNADAPARGATPELLLGVAMLSFGGGGALVSDALAAGKERAVVPGLVLVTLGGWLIAVFGQRVFRPGGRWSGVALAAAAVVLAAGLWHQLAALGTGDVRQSPALALSRALVLGWSAAEALRFRRDYVRRAALGLADPVVANRLLLFAAWISALALMPVALQVVTLFSVEGAAWRARAQVPIRLVGAFCLVTIYLTFFPPQAYLRWLRRGEPATTEAP